VELTILPNQGTTFGPSAPTGLIVTRPAATPNPDTEVVRDITIAVQFANGLPIAPYNGGRVFPFTVLTRGVPVASGPAASPEIYSIAWESLAPIGPHAPVDDPRDFILDFQATAPGRQVIFSFPYDGGGAGPTAITIERFGAAWTPTTPIVTTATSVASVAALSGFPGTAYYYDATAKRLWVAPATISNVASLYAAPAYLAVFDGRSMRLVVNG
jgi:hypothetical protein